MMSRCAASRKMSACFRRLFCAQEHCLDDGSVVGLPSSSTSEKTAEPPSQVETDLSNRDRVPLSCTKAFDSMYYCYSPVYQGRQYYMTGALDDCRGRVRRFRMCVLSRVRNQDTSERIYEEEEQRDRGTEKKAEPVWRLRPEYVARIAELERTERQQRQEKNAAADEDLQNWWR
eukprot:IDg13772t1